MGSLNIKTKEAYELAQRLAAITGESMATAVTTSLRERLDRVQGTPMSNRLLEIGRQCAAHLKEPYKSAEHGDLLYDDVGLPK